MIVTLPRNYNKAYYNKWLAIGMSVMFGCWILKSCGDSETPDSIARRSFTMSLPAFGFPADTTKPVKQYFYIIKISPQEWQSTMDTLQGVMGEFGVDMKVSDARNYQQLFYRQLGRLGSKVSLDSVIIKK